ncbi:MAG: efflux RND transporter periplasmic adaptor subunit, partial [Deltaproteobacteria bacterium]|nr:efflux RND transporter periplasmic adaptor subunit [Deltaproteobacteria bacterium]
MNRGLRPRPPSGASMAEARRCPLWVRILRVVLPIVILAAGALGARYYIQNKPTAKKGQAKKTVQLVEVLTVSRGPARVVLPVMGTVIPARSLDLKAQVSGRVEWMDPALDSGGALSRGEVILRLDPADHRLAVQTREAALAKAKADLELELGHQQVARRELEIVASGVDEAMEETALALRQPQLQKIKAEVAQAETALAQARLDLERTTVRAPFDALVLERFVDIGSEVGSRERLASLVGRNEFRIQASVPTGWLAWMDIPGQGADTGSPAVVSAKPRSGEWKATVFRLLPGVEDNGRMARVLLTVPDPFGGPDGALLLDDFVRVRIVGRELTDVAVLPRKALRDG